MLRSHQNTRFILCTVVHIILNLFMQLQNVSAEEKAYCSEMDLQSKTFVNKLCMLVLNCILGSL